MVKTLPSNAAGAGLIPGWETKIPHACGPRKQNRKQKWYCNKFHKDLKNGPHQKIFFFFKEKKISKYQVHEPGRERETERERHPFTSTD